MNTKKYNWILYLITATIIATIAVQLYWNYKNYELNKQRVLNEIQISLDKAIDDYYHNLSQKNFLTIIEPKSPTSADIAKKTKIWQHIIADATNDTKDSLEKNNSRINISSIEIRTDQNGEYNTADSILVNDLFKQADKNYSNHIHENSRVKKILQLSENGGTGLQLVRDSIKNTNQVKVFRGEKARDSIKLLRGLKTMYIAIHNDSLAYQDLDSLLSNELREKKIDVDFTFQHYKKDTLFFNYNSTKNTDKYFFIDSQSTYFKEGEKLEMYHTNPSFEALKRSSTGILLSLLLSIAIISSLFYLLKIINQQKQLAEIKNDLISNITHEFKTPITTVSTAIEAIKNFNVINDKEKTKKYLSISSLQLNKLNLMVEKLLETATLDSENLMLKKESVDIVNLVEKITTKHQLITAEKTITFSSNIENKIITIDVFHFENAISNLIDNAIKYGGNLIEVTISSVLSKLEILVVDNGKGIEKSQRDKVFDKFYRVSKGNTHDVKGFGIGLYYSKKIIEKHGGLISLDHSNNLTTFKITFQND